MLALLFGAYFRLLRVLVLVVSTILLSHTASASNCSLYQNETYAGGGMSPGISLPVTLDVGEKLTLRTEVQPDQIPVGGVVNITLTTTSVLTQSDGPTLLLDQSFHNYSGSGTESVSFVAHQPYSQLEFVSYAYLTLQDIRPVSLYFRCTVAPDRTTTSLQVSAPASLTGTEVTLTATVADASNAGKTPEGEVEFLDGSTSIGRVPLVGDTAILKTSALSIATHTLRARFVGTEAFAESTSDPVDHEVTDPNGADTEVTLVESKTTASINETVMLTVTVTAATGTPVGKVKLTQQGISVIGDFPLVNGVAEIPFSSNYLGTYNITAEYAAMPGFKAATGQVMMTFGKAPSELLMTSSKNPANLNEPVTFIVTPVHKVTRAKLGSGRVYFYDGNTLLAGGRTIPVNFSSNDPAIRGTVRFTIPNTLVGALSVGVHQIKAVYLETDLNLGSEMTFSQTIVVPDKPTTTLLSTSKNPAQIGESVTFSASVVTSDTGAKATGNVEFYNGDTLLGSSALADGVATVSSSFNDVGELQITARYLGEANAFAACTSATLTQRIDKFGTSVSLASTPNPSQQGQEVSLTATVTSPAGTPAGTVEFFDGVASLGTAALSGGIAVFTTSALEAGSHDLTAVYSGSASEAASTSAVLSHGVGTESAEIDQVQQQASQAAAGASTDVITDITSEVISDALSGQVQVLSASDGKVGLTWAPGLKRGGTMIVPTADALPTTESSWRFWVKGRYTDWDAGSLDGELWNGMAGASLLFGDGMVAGLVAGYESYDYEDTVGASLKGDGLSLGGYVGGKLTDSLTFDTQLHSAFIDYDVASGGISGDFDATRLIAAGGFSYALHDGALSFTPSLRANAMWEWQDGYIDTAAVAHGARGFGNARVSGGARVAYTIPLSVGGRFIPYISGYGDWRVSDGDQTIDSALDGVSGRIESGFDLQTKGGINFGASVEFMGLGIEDTLATSYRANLSIPF